MFNERYLEVLQHYGIEASKNTLGNTHENGDVEIVEGSENIPDTKRSPRGTR